MHIFVIPIDRPSNLFCDIESVYNNSTFSESQLKKKHIGSVGSIHSNHNKYR